jgi:anti-sigma-K factor RskA
MTHAEMDELYELFVLGALEPAEQAEIEKHLEEGCTYCNARVREARDFAAAFAGMVDVVQPPAELRQRVLDSIAPPAVIAKAAKSKQKNWMGGMIALGAACAALMVFCLWLGSQTDSLQNRLSAATQERDQLEQALKVLSRSETRTVQFGKADQPRGRVFVNPTGGVVFVASGLPKIGPDRTFELWLVPPAGAPRKAGLFRSDANGDIVQASRLPVDLRNTAAVAVSVEPDGGSNAPTTTPIIVVPLG